MQVCKIGPPTAGDANFLPHFGGVFEHQHLAPALFGNAGTHKAGSAAADDNDVKVLHQLSRMKPLFNLKQLFSLATENTFNVGFTKPLNTE
jgi:hypothetical protein